MPDDKTLYMLLGEMSADIKNILKKSVDQDERLNGHGSRIHNLEKFQWKIVGAYTAVTIILGLAIKFI